MHSEIEEPALNYSVVTPTLIAEQEGRAPEELPPLYNVIDDSHLNGLLDNFHRSIELKFTYLGHEVSVFADACVEVTEHDSDSSQQIPDD